MADEQQANSESAAPQSGDELRQVKLDKLNALRAAGSDPFREVRYDRTHSAAAVEQGFD